MNGIFQLRRWASLALLVLAPLTVASAQPAPRATALSLTAFRSFCPNLITQTFPTIGPAQTTWLICWHEVAGNNSLANPNGLVIGPVYFRKSPSALLIDTTES